MKKVFLTLFTLIFSFSATAVTAAVVPGDIPDNPREVPASVYEVPFPADVHTTQYAPWLKNFHLMNEDEYNRGLYGGEACQQIKIMKISPVNPNLLYFITDTSGIYKSTDGGKHWYNTSGNLPSYFGQGLLCDRFDENTVYAAMGTDGVYRSRDGGKNWQLLVRDRKSSVHNCPDRITQDGLGNVFIAASSGIYKLEHGKDIPVNLYPQYSELSAAEGANFNDIRVSDDGMLIIVTCSTQSDNVKAGLYISRDNGKTWEIKNVSSEEGSYTSAHAVEIHPEDQNRLFLSASIYGSDNKKTEGGLYESLDGGATWTKTFELFYENASEGVSKTAKNITILEFGPKNAEGIYPLYGAGRQIQYPLRVSYDYGRSFTPIHGNMGKGTFRQRVGTDGETGWWDQGFAVDMKNPGVVIFACAGIYRYDNGNIDWIGSGFSGLSLTWMNMDKDGNMILSATDAGTIVGNGAYTADSYPMFTLTDKQILIRNITDPNNPKHIIGYNGNSNTSKKELGIVESFDGGITFSEIKPDTVNSGNTRVLEYDRDNPDIIYSSKHTSYDNGKTWTPNEYSLLAISKKNPDNMLASATVDNVVKLYISRDRGKTWEFLMNGKSGYVTIAFDMKDDNYIWYSHLNNFGRINVSAKKDENHNHKFPYPTFDYFAQNPKNPDHMVMSLRGWLSYGDSNYKNGQVVESTDGGESWHVVPGFWSSYYQTIFFSTTTDEAFLCGHAGTFIYNYKKYHEFLKSKITVQMDGREISFSVMPEIVEGRTMVPMRELFEMLGAEILWDSETRSVTAKKGKSTVKLQIDNPIVDINGEEVQMEAAPYIKNNRTMIPLRFASEALGIRVGWDSANRLIVMKSN